ncbi:MAG: hypothetical protein ACTSUE_25945 [Promethearchaeota archaeon]
MEMCKICGNRLRATYIRELKDETNYYVKKRIGSYCEICRYFVPTHNDVKESDIIFRKLFDFKSIGEDGLKYAKSFIMYLLMKVFNIKNYKDERFCTSEDIVIDEILHDIDVDQLIIRRIMDSFENKKSDKINLFFCLLERGSSDIEELSTILDLENHYVSNILNVWNKEGIVQKWKGLWKISLPSTIFN